MPLYLKYSKESKHKLYKRVKENYESKRIIVSLTSFPRRIPTLWMVIDILTRQTIKADKILLYLSKEQFPNLDKDLPNSLLKYKKNGLDIIFVDDDIRSHKKYYYAFHDYPNDIIITIDDDIFYPTSLIETLLNYHKKYPMSIICRYAREIKWDKDGNTITSHLWQHIRYNRFSDKAAFFGTGGGTLFPSPSKCLHGDVLNIQLARKLAPIEDDLWLNTMVRLKKTPIIVVKDYKDILPVLIRDNKKLFTENGGEINQTDIQLNNIIEYYKKFNLKPFDNKNS